MHESMTSQKIKKLGAGGQAWWGGKTFGGGAMAPGPPAGYGPACVHAKPVHFEYSLWTDVDFVHIYYIQCDLFDCYIFNYEIMPATLANTFLFILQGSLVH